MTKVKVRVKIEHETERGICLNRSNDPMRKGKWLSKREVKILHPTVAFGPIYAVMDRVAADWHQLTDEMVPYDAP